MKKLKQYFAKRLAVKQQVLSVGTMLSKRKYYK